MVKIPQACTVFVTLWSQLSPIQGLCNHINSQMIIPVERVQSSRQLAVGNVLISLFSLIPNSTSVLWYAGQNETVTPRHLPLTSLQTADPTARILSQGYSASLFSQPLYQAPINYGRCFPYIIWLNPHTSLEVETTLILEQYLTLKWIYRDFLRSSG